MANVFAILTAIVLAVSAFLAVKNSSAYFSDDPGSPGIVQQRQKQERIRDKQTTELADVQDTLGATTEDREGTEATAEEKLTVLTEQQKKNKGIESKTAANKEKVSSNQAQISDMENKLKDVGDIEDLVAGLKRDQAEIERLDAGIGESQATLANLTSNVRSTGNVIETFKTVERSHVNKVSFCKSARISSVYGTWGFVTLSAGNAAGIVQGSFLNVVRSGETIAKLYVTGVEASSAAADIVPDSLKADTVLMVGDRVEPAKKEDVTEGAATPAPAATGPAPAAAVTPAATEEPAPEPAPEPEPAPAVEPEPAPVEAADDPF